VLKGLKKVVILLLICMVSSVYLVSGVMGAVKGHIYQKGTEIPLYKVKITIISTKSKTVQHRLFSDKKGYFYKSGLLPGLYQIKYEKSGYIPVKKSIRITISETQKVNTYLEIIKEKPQAAAVRLMKEGMELINAGKYQEAIKKITEAISKQPGNFVLFYNRAFCYEKKEDFKNALLDYRESIRLKPDFILSLSNAAKIFAKQKDFPKAIEYYQKAFELGTTDIVTLYNYGVCLINTGKNQKALTILEKLISLDPNYADALYHIGIVYLGLDNMQKAKESLLKFIKIEPENKNVQVAKEIIKSLKQ